MRRNTPSFTVEVRRTSKRATSQEAKAWLSETTPRISESTRLSHLAANAPFRAKPAEELSHEVKPQIGTGRILPSLVDAEPVGQVLQHVLELKQETTSASPMATRQQNKPRHRGVATSAPTQNAQPAIQADTLAADDGAGVQASDDGDPPPDQKVAAPLHSQPAAAARKVRVREPSRKAASSDSEHNQVVPLPDGLTTMAELDAKAVSLTNIQATPQESAPVRKRHIIGRYVVGDEFKPGERWKHRLRWKR